MSKNQQIQNILLKHHSISEFKTIVYCWVPSHVGIYGNEQVDKKAKESLSLDQQILKFLLSILNLLSTSMSLMNGNQFGAEQMTIN